MSFFIYGILIGFIVGFFVGGYTLIKRGLHWGIIKPTNINTNTTKRSDYIERPPFDKSRPSIVAEPYSIGKR